MDRSQIAQALVRRARSRRPTRTALAFDPAAILTPPQLAFARDVSPRKIACTTRRSGKSVAAAVNLLTVAANEPGVTVAFVAITRAQAKKVVWTGTRGMGLVGLCRRYFPGAKLNRTDLTIELENGSRIELYGCDKAKEIDKLRGGGYRLVILDECQSWGGHLQELIDAVLDAAGLDFAGSQVTMLGTPAPAPVGPFFDAWSSPAWVKHFWTLFENPHLGQDPATYLADVRQRRGVDETDPTYRREFLGEWVIDTEALVFRYSEITNDLPAGFEIPRGDQPRYVIGVDFGFNDRTAYVVFRVLERAPFLDLVEEFERPGMMPTETIALLAALALKYPGVIRMVGDPATGKGVIEELRRDHGTPIVAADKKDKIDNIHLLNDDLRAGRIRLPKGSKAAKYFRQVEWEPEKRGQAVKGHMPDLLDALLYAARAARPYLRGFAPPEPEKTVDELAEEAFDRQLEARREAEEWGAGDPFAASADPFASW